MSKFLPNLHLKKLRNLQQRWQIQKLQKHHEVFVGNIVIEVKEVHLAHKGKEVHLAHKVTKVHRVHQVTKVHLVIKD